MDDEIEVDAGSFGRWTDEILAAIDGVGDSDVPCGACTACCTASQFVHIGPDERDALDHIPGALLFPAPRMPAGHVLMGYDQHGRCPMLRDDGCSIYAHRPRTCRTYDCRVFPASGVTIDETDEPKRLIAERAATWTFRYPTDHDAVLHDAVRAAAEFVRRRSADLPQHLLPTSASEHAVAAVRIHRSFVRTDAVGGATEVVEPTAEAVAEALAEGRNPPMGRSGRGR